MKERESDVLSVVRFLFVGENRSNTAKNKGYTWQNVPEGELCARKLFTALRIIGIEPREQDFVNIYDDEGNLQEIEPNGHIVIAMGQKVQSELDTRNIPYLKVVHPAARGIWCRQENYNQHIASTLREFVRINLDL